MSKRRNWTIPLISYLLRDLRKFVDDATQELPKDVRDASIMVAVELASNAIKHGVSVPDAEAASIELTMSPHEIRFEVSNGVSSPDALKDLQNRIHRIATAESKEQLYMERLQQMLDDPKETGKLGLLRIGFEGRFELSYKYSDQIVTVIATRGIQ